MKRVCIITATRSEYGLLKWVIDNVYRDPDLQLQLVVTGAHLCEEYGNTVRFIEEDGFPIAARIDMHLESSNQKDIVRSMGYCTIGMAETLSDLQPDLIVVLGDRFELLPVVSAALVMRIPVAHISGGDVTEGAIDNEIRNAISMMSTLHFPGVDQSADNLRRMLGSRANIFTAGEPGLDSFLRLDLLNRVELAESIGLNSDHHWCLVTLHPETRLKLNDNIQMAQSLFKVMQSTTGIQFIISKANADYGGKIINDFWTEAVMQDTGRFKLIASLGQLRYLSLMQQATGVIGNSSSGIVEAPFLGIPAINIGNRQKGRHLCKNVIQCNRDQFSIHSAFKKMLKQPRLVDNYYGDGHTAERILKHIKSYLYA